RLLPDMSARIAFIAENEAPSAERGDPAREPSEPQILVPAAAVRRDAQGRSFVWAVRDGQVRSTPVEVAGSVGDRVRIRQGLTGGEAVVVSDDAGLVDGRAVKGEGS